jgi:hypothetical protein
LRRAALAIILLAVAGCDLVHQDTGTLIAQCHVDADRIYAAASDAYAMTRAYIPVCMRAKGYERRLDGMCGQLIPDAAVVDPSCYRRAR